VNTGVRYWPTSSVRRGAPSRQELDSERARAQDRLCRRRRLHQATVAKIVALAQSADILVTEATFLQEDDADAAARQHSQQSRPERWRALPM